MRGELRTVTASCDKQAPDVMVKNKVPRTVIGFTVVIWIIYPL